MLLRRYAIALSLALAAVFSAGSLHAGWWKKLKKKVKKAAKEAELKHETRRLNRKQTESSSDVAAAVRGLEEDGGLAEHGDRDFDGVDWLDGIRISQKELRRFIREGKLAR